MGELVKPESILGIANMQPEEINKFNEEVMKANVVLDDINDELVDLSQSIRSLYESKERYDKNVKHVKGQMRSLLGKL